MKEKVHKYNITIIFLIFLIISSMPTYYFISNENNLKIINGVIRVVYGLFLVIFIRRSKNIQLENKRVTTKTLLLLPFLIATINNILPSILANDFILKVDLSVVLSEMIFFIGVAFVEEIVFRGVIFGYLCEKVFINKPIKAYLLSSAIFSISHFVNILNNGIGITLLQIGYTFLTGLLFVFIYDFTKNIKLVIAVHFLYNFINQTIFTSIIDSTWNYTMYIVTIINIVFLSTYGIILYSFYNKKIKKVD